MSWSESQQYRLGIEKKLLAVYMPDFSFYKPTGVTYLSGTFETNAGSSYGVRVEIPSGFPDQCPPAYITSPNPLWRHGQADSFWRRLMEKSINEEGISHEMHTLSPHTNGWVQVCHFRSERWSADVTLVQVLVKIRLWLEAYELHCATGRPIDDFMITQPEKPEETA